MRYAIIGMSDTDLETIAAALDAYEGLFHAAEVREAIHDLGARIDNRDDSTVREYDENEDTVEVAP